jgi:hypothetical protein
MLTIYEELFLLALDEQTGSIFPFAKKPLAHGLAGGILAELALQGKICSNEKHRLEWLDPASTGDEFLDGAIKEIQAEEKHRKLAYWISQLSARPKRLREGIGERLVAKDLLYQEDRSLFWHPGAADGSAAALTKYDLKLPLRALVLSQAESDPHRLALLDVASAAGLLGLIFTQDELPLARQRIHEKVVRAALENPAMQTIEEIEQAIVTSLEDDTD